MSALGQKRTFEFAAIRSACDPKRTLRSQAFPVEGARGEGLAAEVDERQIAHLGALSSSSPAHSQVEVGAAPNDRVVWIKHVDGKIGFLVAVNIALNDGARRVLHDS